MIGLAYYGNEHKLGNIYVCMVKLNDKPSFIHKISRFIKAGDLDGAFSCANSANVVGNKITIKPINAYYCRSSIENNKSIALNYIDMLNSIHMFWTYEIGMKEIVHKTNDYLAIIEPKLEKEFRELELNDNVAMKMAEIICKSQFNSDMHIHEIMHGEIGTGIAGDEKTEKFIKENPLSPFVKKEAL